MINPAYERQYISKCPKCEGNISIQKSPVINSDKNEVFYYLQCDNCEYTPFPSIFDSEESAFMNLNYQLYHINICPICNSKTQRKIMEITDNKQLCYSVKCTKCGVYSNLAKSPKIACDNWNQEKFTFICPNCHDNYYAFSYCIKGEKRDTFYIRCLNCGKSTTSFPTLQEAVKAWKNKIYSQDDSNLKSEIKESVNDNSDELINFTINSEKNHLMYRINQNNNKNFQDFVDQYFKTRHVHRLLYNSTQDDMTEIVKLLISAITIYGKTLSFSPTINLFKDNISKADYLVLENGSIAMYLYQINEDKINNYLIYI